MIINKIHKILDVPVIMSTSSLVIAACRPRLYFNVSESIMSPAFLDALSMALRLRKSVRHVLTQIDTVPGLPRALFTSVALDECGVDSVGKGELRKVLRDVVLHLVRLVSSYT